MEQRAQHEWNYMRQIRRMKLRWKIAAVIGALAGLWGGAWMIVDIFRHPPQ
jgi:hypothetical protein